jgi:hypothetical protein
MEVFEASVRVATALRRAMGSSGPWVYPLSEGYVALAVDRDGERAAAVLPVAIDSSRTAVLTNGGSRPAALPWRPDGRYRAAVYAVAPSDGYPTFMHDPPTSLSPGSTCFVLPLSFLKRVRERAPAAEPTAAGTPLTAAPSGRDPNGLAVIVLGVGPGGEAPLSVRSATLCDVEHVIVFDRIRDKVLEGLATHGVLHVVPYIYTNFDQSVEEVGRLLNELEAGDAHSVAIAVEGNPEILDLAPRLAHGRRNLTVIPARPIALRGTDKVARITGVSLIGCSYALISGLPRRHLTSRDGLARELSGYLCAGLGCVLIEMYRGDLDLVVETLAGLPGDRIIAVLSNLYSATEQIDLFGSADCATQATRLMLVERGELTTVVVSAPQSAGVSAGLVIPRDAI